MSAPLVGEQRVVERRARASWLLGWSSLLGLGGLSLAWMTGCDGREREPERKTEENYVAAFDLEGPIAESTVGAGLFPLPASETYTGLVRRIAGLGDDQRARAVFVTFSGGLGFFRAEELGELLGSKLRDDQKVICHAHGIDNAGVWFGLRACDELWVSAAGDVSTVGIGAELAYLKGALDKLGVTADMMAVGKFKSGGEALTRESPSDEALLNLGETIRDLRTIWLEGVGRQRPNGGALRAAVEDGPWAPEKARELGLVTHVGFADEALAAARAAGKTQKVEVLFGGGGGGPSESPLAEIVRVISGADQRDKKQPHIAVVAATGSISTESGGIFGGGGGISSTSLTRTIRRLRENEAVRAIVLRLDSPGGSPLASDLIWRELMLTRAEKPVVVSIGSMAASGGYYLASGATKIVAPRTAIVGSIGVFGGKIVIGGALERLGIKTYPVPASEAPGAAARAAHLSPMNAWDDATRERVRASMQSIYDLFIARVAEGRSLPPDAVRATAEGAIFLSHTAKERGLIDELGGLSESIELARKLAKLGQGAPVRMEGGGETLMEMLLLGPGAGADEVQAAIARYEAGVRAQALPGSADLTTQLAPFRAALEPLLAGEASVVALPYSLTLR